MTTPLLAVKGLSVRAGLQQVLENVSFELDAGRILGLFGDSGAGKSTLLHAICGLDAPGLTLSGSILFDGRPVVGMSPEARSHLGMGIVLQGLGLFDDRTVFENTVYPLRRRKVPVLEAQSRVEEVLAFLGLDALSGRYPHQLSGGQRQRVALARAIIYRPLLLLLDEPLRGLQEELRYDFLAYLGAIAAQGTTLVFVTHDRQELQLVADELIVLKDGTASSRQLPAPAGFAALESAFPITGRSGGCAVRLGNLRIAGPGDQDLGAVEVITRSWRALGGATRAALVEHPGGELGFLIFENLPQDPSTLPLGPIRVIGNQKG